MPASRAPRATPTTGERPYHLGDLRRTLLEEGWAATIESGGKDISLREIARRAGVSATASFHHFRNKEALLAAVAVEGFARLTATLRKRVESIDDPTERLRIVLRTYIEFAIEHPAVFFRMFGLLLSTPNKYPDLRTAALASFDGRLGRMGCDARRCKPARCRAWIQPGQTPFPSHTHRSGRSHGARRVGSFSWLSAAPKSEDRPREPVSARGCPGSPMTRMR
jgi:AcrR family transcriptional regulator